MHAMRVDQQTKRGVTHPTWAHAAGADGAQEGVLDPDQGSVIFGGHGFAARGIGAAAPDGDTITGFGPPIDLAKVQAVPGKCQDAAQAGLAQEACVVKEKPPGDGPGGV